MNLSEPYLQALATWERRYALFIGESYCDDCISFALERGESSRPKPTTLLPLHEKDKDKEKEKSATKRITNFGNHLLYHLLHTLFIQPNCNII